jgi:hypothetical protein
MDGSGKLFSIIAWFFDAGLLKHSLLLKCRIFSALKTAARLNRGAQNISKVPGLPLILSPFSGISLPCALDKFTPTFSCWAATFARSTHWKQPNRNYSACIEPKLMQHFPVSSHLQDFRQPPCSIIHINESNPCCLCAYLHPVVFPFSSGVLL